MNTVESQAMMQKLRSAMLEALSHKFDTFDSTAERFLRLGKDTLGVNRVSLWKFERGRQRIVLYKMVDDGVIKGNIPTSIDRQGHERYFDAIVQNFVVDASDAANDPRTRELAANYLLPAGIVSMLDVALRSLGDQIGVICIEHSQARQWHPFEQSFVSGMAAQISLAIERDELSEANRALVQRVLFDELTKLPNFLYADDRLRVELGELERHQDLGVALIHADIEQFLLICNSLGQSVAHMLLRNLAERLKVLCGKDALVARSGDDDFVIILRSADPAAEALKLCRRIIEAMNLPLPTDGREVLCSLSLGYAIRRPGDAEMTPEALFREAWTASRSARRSATPKQFERALLVQTALEVELEQALRLALREGQFEPHFQPIVSSKSATIVGFEALMRWRQNQRLVTPVEFMSVAQRTGLIVPIGQEVVKRTIDGFSKLQAANPGRQWHMNINLSPPEFLRDGLVQELCEQLRIHNVRPDLIALEITESVVIEDMSKAQRVIETLQQFGIKVFLDDLGTGFSSLNYLRALPVDGVKLDYSFTNDIERNRRAQALIAAVARVAQELQQNAVAEGVEWESQFAALLKAGLHEFQGFLFAKATAIEEITPAWVEELERRVRALILEATSNA